MPKCYQLIGVPASGKTTWYQNQDWAISYAYISTDKWVEIFAKEIGSTYSKVFTDFMPTEGRLGRMSFTSEGPVIRNFKQGR